MSDKMVKWLVGIGIAAVLALAVLIVTGNGDAVTTVIEKVLPVLGE